MTLLTAPALTRLQTRANHYLNNGDLVQVVRNTTADDGFGGATSSWNPVGSPVNALITPWIGRSGGIEEVRQGRFEQTSTWKISLPALTDAKAEDRITSGGRTWEVKVVAAQESLEVLRELICVERLSG